MDSTTTAFLEEIWRALEGPPVPLDQVEVSGGGALPSAFPVTELAAASIGAAGLAISELVSTAGSSVPRVVVDRRLASLWFGWSIRPIGWTLPAVWDPLAGDYRTRDGWIKLHTNAARHRAAALKVLGAHRDKAAIADTVSEWSATELESVIVAAGGCAAEMRSEAEWRAHPQGRVVNAEPLLHWTRTPLSGLQSWTPRAERPLEGIRVLDLTRVLAGPVAGRFLAGYGADVLRIDPPDWDEPGVIPEVSLGKRCARLDLRAAADRKSFESLLGQADILIHGYRPDALDGLGYGEAARRALAPDLIEVTLDAYGWTGPWRHRRGFDSLVQMSSGIAARGMEWKGADVPTPLPVQALDHATGYLMAAAAIRALTLRLAHNERSSIRASLARTVALLSSAPQAAPDEAITASSDRDYGDEIEQTSWGEAHRLRPPTIVKGAPMGWRHPARALGTSAASFTDS